jgi:hypothetical protein
MDINVRVICAKTAKALLIVIGVRVALSVVGIDITLLSVFGGALGVGPCDPCALVVRQFDQPGLRQFGQALADDRAADAEIGTELLLNQPRARGEAMRLDRLDHALEHDLGRRDCTPAARRCRVFPPIARRAGGDRLRIRHNLGFRRFLFHVRRGRAVVAPVIAHSKPIAEKHENWTHDCIQSGVPAP